MREKTGLRATGKRWLNKIKCRTCKGKGKQPSQEQIDCTHCKGVGYFEDSKKNDVLCFLCKGQRVIAKNLDVGCVDCKGKGHLSKIMKRFSSEKACKKCSGTGTIRCATKKLTDCRCRGTGKVEYCDSVECDECKGKGSTTVYIDREV